MNEDELRTQILCEMRAASKVFIGEELLDHLTDIALRHVSRGAPAGRRFRYAGRDDGDAVMPRAWAKTPSDPWPLPGNGDTIHILAGVHEAHEFDVVEDLTIQGQAGAVVRGSVAPRGGEPHCSLRFPDGCHGLRVLGPLEITGSYGRGLRVTASERVVISGIKSHGHGIEAIILGDCPGAQVTDVECYGSVPGDPSYPPDKRHGLYISGNASSTIVKGLRAHNVTGSGFQANGPGMGVVITNLRVSEMLLERCGSGGTPPISLMGVQDSVIEEFCIPDVPAERWAVLFADGQGEKFACKRNTFRVYSVPAGSIASEEEGSGGNTFAPGAGWSPGPTPTPVPNPAPTPTPPDPLAEVRTALDGALKALTEQKAQIAGAAGRGLATKRRRTLDNLNATAADLVTKAEKALPAG